MKNITNHDLQMLAFSIINGDNANKIQEIISNAKEDVVNMVLPYTEHKDDSINMFANTTPLYIAIKCQNIDAVKVLLDNGADIKKIVVSPDGMVATPYDLAVNFEKNEEIKNLLIQNKNNRINNIVSTTAVVRSSNSHSIQYGKNK